MRWDHAGLSQLVLNPMTCPNKRQKRRKTVQRQKLRSENPQAKECWQSSEVWKGQGTKVVSFLELLKEAQSYRHLNFRLWPPELWENILLLFCANKFVVIGFDSPRKLTWGGDLVGFLLCHGYFSCSVWRPDPSETREYWAGAGSFTLFEATAKGNLLGPGRWWWK